MIIISWFENWDTVAPGTSHPLVDWFLGRDTTYPEQPADPDGSPGSSPEGSLEPGSNSTNPLSGLTIPETPNSAHVSYPKTPQKVEFIDAPMAEHYRMSKSTAYQEALANTAYQRKVEDLKKAGLNPVLGISGAGAASFYGVDASSGGVGYGSAGSGKDTSNLGGLSSVISSIAGLIGVAVAPAGSKIAAGSFAASSAYRLIEGLQDLFDN